VIAPFVIPPFVLKIMLQKASPQDTSRLAQLKDGFDKTDIVARFHWLSTVNVTWYIWWIEHEPRGWALIAWNGKASARTYPDLFDLYVQPGWRNQGVGTQILMACEEIVREAGHRKIGLAVNPDLNPQAYLLYQRLGYFAPSQHKYVDGVYNGIEDWVIDLEKDL
jgi:GNAT superfamily N-acetyltransferase